MKKSKNLLPMRPRLLAQLTLSPLDEERGTWQLEIPRTHWLERIVIRLTNQPSYRQVRLDSIGGFVLQRCDGQHQVQEIAEQLYQVFGEEVEPVLERLVAFLHLTELNGWIIID